jgi:hypothetical protein
VRRRAAVLTSVNVTNGLSGVTVPSSDVIYAQRQLHQKAFEAALKFWGYVTLLRK